MLKNFFHFLKYNNATIIILGVILILGGGVFAAGPEAIGEKQTSIQGFDNTALLAADFNNFNMDFKIEKIEQDGQYYFVTYSYLDLNAVNQAWQYQLNQKTVKVSKKVKDDLGVYLAKYLLKHQEARTRELKKEKDQAESQGLEKRIEVTEYSGLIGRTLSLAAKVFPGYEPVVKRELPTPENFNLPTGEAGQETPLNPPLSGGREVVSGADSLTQVYNDYVAEHPEIFSASSTTPIETDIASSSPADSAGSPQATTETPADSAGSTPTAPEPESVDIIELPASPSVEPITPVEPTPESAAPAEEPTAPVEPAPAQ